MVTEKLNAVAATEKWKRLHTGNKNKKRLNNKRGKRQDSR